MNFFEHQDRARHKTRHLAILFITSVILIVAAVNLAVYGVAQVAAAYPKSPPRTRFEVRNHRYYSVEPPSEQKLQPYQLFLGTTAVTLLIILGGSAYKTASLSGGGPAVAQLLGGRPIDPAAGRNDEAMLQNVVEEMSIASGVPVPRIYVLDRETGINAFAAGFTTNDAVIAVTRGAIEKLNRDELQGVVAHEFSHILNGDMRLNIRLIGLLHGILVIGLIGYGLLRTLAYARPSGRRSEKGAGAIVLVLLLGAALFVIGYVGVFFGRLIQAAVSRQREFLADASAVQFTRNPAGLAGALKKLGGYSSASRVNNSHAMEAAHLFFANGAGISFSRLLATHPPLIERIKAIDPTFDGKFERVGAHTSLTEQYNGSVVPLVAGRTIPLSGPSVVAAAGTIAPTHLTYAAGMLASIPVAIAAAAREPFGARAVAFALLAGAEPEVRQKQLEIVRQSVESACYEQTAGMIPSVASLGEGARLPLLDLALPALRQLSPQQSASFRGTVRAMIQADGRVTLFELAMHRIVEKQLAPPDASKREPMLYYAIAAVRDEAAMLLSALAASSTAQTERAFDAGARRLDPADPPSMATIDGLQSIDAALRKLSRCSPAVKQRLIDAAAHTVAADGEVNVAEAELLRVTAATLDVPLPPILT